MKRTKILAVIEDDLNAMREQDWDDKVSYPSHEIMAKIILNSLEIYGMLPPGVATKEVVFNPVTGFSEIKYMYEWEDPIEA